LQFSGLSDGLHHFDYTIDGAFFKEFEYNEFEECDITVSVELNKQPGMLELKFTFSGYVVCECDRCLENYKQPVSGNERLVVKFGDDSGEPTDDMIVLPQHEHKIDLSQYILESIILLLPTRRVHSEDENGNSDCNPEIIKKLNELEKPKNTDPRWDDLKKLTSKN
jgi:uncharacterized protein